jgi:hypothetical protein
MAANWIAYKTAKPSATYDQVLDSFKKTAVSTIGRQGTFTKLVDLTKALSYNSIAATVPAGPTAAEIAAAKAAADKIIADKAAADAAAAKAIIQAQVNAAIAAAEAQYQIDLKAAQDKLAATKATWLAKLNG